MRMEWRKCFRRKRAVIAALAAVLLMAILFNLAEGMYRWHVRTNARLLKWVDFNVTAEAMKDALNGGASFPCASRSRKDTGKSSCTGSGGW